nr:MAG TPA: hypothetical protein [Caudoviricetes sp.]
MFTEHVPDVGIQMTEYWNQNADDANITNTTKQRKQEVHKHEDNCSYEPERRYR